MHLDLSKYPPGYTFGAIVSEAIGAYVKLADFTSHKGTKMFRLIMDPELSYQSMNKLLNLTISDGKLTYGFYNIESVQALVIDSVDQRSRATTYLRSTFVGENLG